MKFDFLGKQHLNTSIFNIWLTFHPLKKFQSTKTKGITAQIRLLYSEFILSRMIYVHIPI